MDDLSKVDSNVRILIALAGLALENAGKEELVEENFTASEISGWLEKRPELGSFEIRNVKKILRKMREKGEKDINDDFGKKCGRVNSLAFDQRSRDTYYYKISGNTAETPLSAKLIVRLSACRNPKTPISSRDEKRIVSEIYDEFKNNSVYKLSSKKDVAKKVKDAEEGFYFTRDKDDLLLPTTRLDNDREFLIFLSNPRIEPFCKFGGEEQKERKTA